MIRSLLAMIILVAVSTTDLSADLILTINLDTQELDWVDGTSIFDAGSSQKTEGLKTGVSVTLRLTVTCAPPPLVAGVTFLDAAVAARLALLAHLATRGADFNVRLFGQAEGA